MEAAAPIPERIPLRWKSAAVVGLLIGMVWACVLTVGNRVEPRFYVHSDGHVSMGGKEAPEINLEEISKPFESLRMWPGRIVIEADPDLPIVRLEPLLFKLGELGFGNYELRVNGTSLNFSLPDGYFNKLGNSNPEFIDLRAVSTPEPPPPMSYDGALQSGDVFVAADETILCGKLLSRISPKLKSGVTMEIHIGNCVMYRWEDEDRVRPARPNHRFPEPIWTRVADYVRRRF